MREPRYSILADIQDAIERAKQGKLALYWQRTIQREYRCKKVTLAEQQAYEQLQSILSEISQWNDEEDLRSDMEEIGGRVWYCHYWEEHYSMVELTEDRNGKFNVDYVLDDAVTPEVRRDAALLAQKEFADRMQEWGISLLNIHIFVLHRRFYERERPYHLRASDLRGNGTDPGNDPFHPHALRCLPLQFCRIQSVQNRHCSQRRPEHGHLHCLPDPARS